MEKVNTTKQSMSLTINCDVKEVWILNIKVFQNNWIRNEKGVVEEVTTEIKATVTVKKVEKK